MPSSAPWTLHTCGTQKQTAKTPTYKKIKISYALLITIIGQKTPNISLPGLYTDFSELEIAMLTFNNDRHEYIQIEIILTAQ